MFLKQWILPILLVSLYISPSPAQFAGGSGTMEEPYLVETLGQLQGIQDYKESHFIQIKDIDARDTENWNEGKGFYPIGDDDVKFTGSYDGNGYVISGLTIHREDLDYIGLFGVVQDSHISNVRLVNANISGKTRVGGLVGLNSYRGEISKSCVSGNISALGWRAGGLVGHNWGQIENSCFEGKVTGDQQVGGLVGLTLGTINGSFATGDVSGSYQIGGLAGRGDGVNIIDSYSSGDVSGAEYDIGGLVGYNWDGHISNSYASGDVSGEYFVGGLVGRMIGRSARITDSYALGAVTGDHEVGGLAGVNREDGEIVTSYASGHVTADEVVGGLVGSNEASVVSSYWDSESSNQGQGIEHGSTDGAVGLTTDEMTGESAFENITDVDFYNIWLLTEGYPALHWERVESIEPPSIKAEPVAPLDGENNISAGDTLRWNKSEWIKEYQLQISLEEDFSDVIMDSVLSDTLFVLESPEFETTYFWRIKAVYETGEGDWSDIWSFATALSTPVEQKELPAAYELKQNYPNPFNPSTQIRFAIPEQTHVNLTIYNILGQKVSTLVNEIRFPGWYNATFEATEQSSGVYIYRLKTDEYVKTKSMTFVK